MSESAPGLGDARVFVAGHRGLVGSAIVRRLQRQANYRIVVRARAELDLTVQADVLRFFQEEHPEIVILAAAKVGGIVANATYPGDFVGLNLMIQTNVIEAARHVGVRRFVFLGSSCIYPALAPQPMREEHLLTSSLEPTNEAYAIAKIAGLKMCEYYHAQYGFPAVSLMPTNLYGPNDNFDLATSHVLPALIRKFHEANGRPVTLWGTGTPRRELLHVDDLANACAFVLELSEEAIVTHAHRRVFNVGFGSDVTIRELAEIVRQAVGSSSETLWDASRPDGPPRKLMDSSRLFSLGWRPEVALRAGVDATYRWFVAERSRGQVTF
jgi:GDP-L-fucose synthase